MSQKEKKIAILGALKEELAVLKQKIRISEKTKHRKVLLGDISGKPVLLGETGVGVEKSRNMIRFILENFPIDYVISIGYAGGVKEGLGIGDLITCTEVLWIGGDTGFLERKGRDFLTKKLDRGEIRKVARIFANDGIAFREGKILTVKDVVESVEEKKWLGETYPVDVVEMETFAIVEEAEKKGVPVVAFRAISDTLQDQLVKIATVNGEVSRLRTGLHAIRHPGTIPKFLSLRENSRKATKVLTKAVMHTINSR